MSQTADLACTYAALILDDGGADVSVSEENAGRRRRKRKKKAAADRSSVMAPSFSFLRSAALLQNAAAFQFSFSAEQTMETVSLDRGGEREKASRLRGRSRGSTSIGKQEPPPPAGDRRRLKLPPLSAARFLSL